jgi:hypothetical protein
VTVDQLTNLVNQPETHQLIVGDYDGSYALGVTDNPPAFLLRVEPSDVGQFPSKVTIRGKDIPVVVKGNFRTPRPQGGH